MKKSYYTFSMIIICFVFIAIDIQSIISYKDVVFKNGYTINLSTRSDSSEELLNEIIKFSDKNKIGISTEFYDSQKSEKILFTTIDTSTLKNIDDTVYETLGNLLEHRIISGAYYINTTDFKVIESLNNTLIPFFSEIEIDLVLPTSIPIILFYYKITFVLILFYFLLTMLFVVHRYSKITLVKKIHGYTKFQLIKSFIQESICLEKYLIPLLLIIVSVFNYYLISDSLLYSNIILMLIIWFVLNSIRVILYKLLILDKSIRKIKNNKNAFLISALNVFKFIFLILIIFTLTSNFTSIINIINAQNSYSFWTSNSELYNFPLNLTPSNVTLVTEDGIPLDSKASEDFFVELNNNYETYLIDHDTNYKIDSNFLSNVYFVNNKYAQGYNLDINKNDDVITVFHSGNYTIEQMKDYFMHMYNLDNDKLDIKLYNNDIIVNTFDPNSMTVTNPIIVEYDEEIFPYLSENFFQNSSIYTDFSDPQKLSNIQKYLKDHNYINIYYNKCYSILTKIEETLKLLKKELITSIIYLISLILIFLIIDYNIIKIYMTRNTKEIMIKATHGYSVMQRYENYLLQNIVASIVLIMISVFLFIFNYDIFIIISAIIIIVLDYILLMILIICLERKLSVVKIKGDE